MRIKQSRKIAQDSNFEPSEFEEISIIDLIEPEEGGPVLRRRPPEAPRFPYHPEEMKYNQDMKKEALGLTDIPKAGPYGSAISRPRESYEEQDFEVANKTGFGGPSVIDVQEDKPPVNIKRKTINKKKKVEYPDDSYFNWLYTGKLKRKIGDKMSSQQKELLKLAKLLKKSGYHSEADSLIVLAQDEGGPVEIPSFEIIDGSSSLSPGEIDPQKLKKVIPKFDDLQIFQREWDRIPEATKEVAKGGPVEAFVRSVSGWGEWHKGDFPMVYGLGTQEWLMIASIFYGTKNGKLNNQKMLDQVLGEYEGLLSGLTIGLTSYTGLDWRTIVDRETDQQKWLDLADIAADSNTHKYFNPDTGNIMMTESMLEKAKVTTSSESPTINKGGSSYQDRYLIKSAQETEEMTDEDGEVSSEDEPLERLEPQLAQKLISFQKYWKQIPENSKRKAQEDPNDAFAYAVQSYTNQDEYLAVAAIYYGTDPKSTYKKLGGAALDEALIKHRTTLLGGLFGFGSLGDYWGPGDSWEEIVNDDFVDYDQIAALFAGTPEAHKYFNPETGNIKVPNSKDKAESKKSEESVSGEDKPSEEGVESTSKTEGEAETKTEPKAETKTEPKAEPKTEPKAEPKSETKSEPKAEPKSEAKKPSAVTRKSTILYYPVETSSGGPIHQLQRQLGVDIDGKFGPITYGAYKSLVGEVGLPQEPDEALAKVLSKKDTKSESTSARATQKIPVNKNVLAAYLLARPGQISGLNLSNRISSQEGDLQADTLGEAVSYVESLSDKNLNLLNSMLNDSISGDPSSIELNLIKLYSSMKSGSTMAGVPSTSTTLEPTIDFGKYYYTSSAPGLLVSKDSASIFRMENNKLVPARDVSQAEIASIIKVIPTSEKPKVRYNLGLLTKKSQQNLEDRISKYSSFYEDKRSVIRTATDGAVEARKNRLKKMGR